MDKVKGLISESDYVEMLKEFTVDRDRLDRMIAGGQKQLSEIEEKLRRVIIATNSLSNTPIWNTSPVRLWKR